MTSPPRPGDVLPLMADLDTKYGVFATGTVVEVLQIRYLLSLDPPGSSSPPRMTATVHEALIWRPSRSDTNLARLERDRRSAELARLRRGDIQTVKVPVLTLADLYLSADPDAQERCDKTLGHKTVDGAVALFDREPRPRLRSA